MTPHHHPSAATLFAYGAGNLPDSLALAVASHFGWCEACHRQAADTEVVGGALLDGLTPAAMAGDALAHTLARIEAAAPAAPEASRTAPQPLALLDRLRTDPEAAETLRWHRLVPGISQIEISPRTGAGGIARLLRVEPGTALPHHGHSGREATIILAGAYTDQLGRFGPGDFAETDIDDWHQPIAEKAGACYCLIATESPLRFTGIVARIMQPFFRI